MDKETYIKAFKEHNKSIYNYIYLKVKLQKNIAEDLVQETFLRAWNYRHTFNPKKAALRTWLFRIANNVVNDYFNKNKLRFEDLSNYSEQVFELEFEDKGIYLESIYNSLTSLSDLEREVVILRYVEDMDLKEISKIINKSYINTKVLIHRSINKLKNKIDEK